jgi:hypothetical protein
VVSLRQLLEFAPENVVHPQSLRDFSSDVAAMRPSGIDIDLL